MSGETERAELAPDRQAVIDDLTRRQHEQANEITAETGQAYVTSRTQAEADGIALRHEREFWEHHHPGRHRRG
jgi:hypothetical protein